MNEASTRTLENILAYSFPGLRSMTAKLVYLDNMVLTKDQFTFTNGVLTLTDSEIKVEADQLLQLWYQWEKKV